MDELRLRAGVGRFLLPSVVRSISMLSLPVVPSGCFRPSSVFSRVEYFFPSGSKVDSSFRTKELASCSDILVEFCCGILEGVDPLGRLLLFVESVSETSKVGSAVTDVGS